MVAEHKQYRTIPVRSMRHGVALLTVLLLLFALAFSWYTWKDGRGEELRHLSVVVEVGEKSLDSYFLQLETSLRLLSLDLVGERGQVDPKRAQFLLARYRDAYPDVRDVAINRVDGQMLASADMPPGVPLPSLARLPSFTLSREELRTGQSLSIARPTIGVRTREWIIPIRYGVRDARGELQYIVSATLPLATPQSFWKHAPLPEGTALSLVRDDGYLVSRFPVPPRVELDAFYGKPRTNGPLVEYMNAVHAAQGQFPTSGVIHGKSVTTGEERIFVFRRLTHHPVTFLLTVPESILREAWWERIRPPLALLILLLAGGYAVYRWVLKRHAAWESEVAHLNEELALRVIQLEAANKEMEAFSYSVSHDLRAPLRSIDGFSQLLLTDAAASLDADASGHLQRIRHAAQHMSEQIDGMLRLARLSRSEVKTERVDLSRIARAILAELQEREPQRKAIVEVQDGVEVDADPHLMHSLLDNLLANAWKFTGKNAETRIRFGSEKRDGQQVVFVRDNGVGFSMEYASKLFGAFQRLHRADEFEGTGIGLATVQRIVNLHGGRIWAQATEGGGATFYFVIPSARRTRIAAR